MELHFYFRGGLLLALALLLLPRGGDSTQPPFSCDSADPKTKSFKFCQKSLPIAQRARDLVSRLTLDEKISQLVDSSAAIPRLGVPAYQWWSEALHGVSGYGRGVSYGGAIGGATSFPQVILSASTFDSRLWYRIGQAIGREARGMYNGGQAQGMTFWTPNINIFRDPRWGRGQETPGEDPMVAAKYAVAHVRGIQGDRYEGGQNGHLLASACCKHFTAYDLDNWKSVSRMGFDAKVTQQDLADTYQPPFRSCVQEGKASGIMCAYNSVNGVPNCADRNLLTKTARGQWGFHGYIVSDCDAVATIYEKHKYVRKPEDAVALALKAHKIRRDDSDCWALIGDFNEVRNANERKGRSVYHFSSSSRHFEEFILEAGLFDIPISGRKYTWSRLDGKCCSRIDRALVSESWKMEWGECKLLGLPKLSSDHCPIFLHYNLQNWGPKPFKFFNAWLNNPEILNFVKEKWSSYSVQGWNSFRLKEKLKRLKLDIKEWSKERYNNLDKKIEDGQNTWRELDAIQEERDLEDHELNLLREAKANTWHWKKVKDSYTFQKARIQWIKEGDANSAFFHRCVNSRVKVNNIEGLMINGTWSDDVSAVKSEVFNHFKSQFSRQDEKRFTINSLVLKMIDDSDNDLLTAPFTESEVKEAVWDCGGNKSPGPDGFSFCFIKKMWSVLKDDIMKFLQEFYQHGKIVKGGNPCFVTLIPKKSVSLHVRDFRPISLIGCSYKILAKMLAKRLAKVITKVVSENQSAFVGDKQILDSILILNESADFLKRSRYGSLIFKVDFEKAYDSVLWEFLDEMMEGMRFCPKWRMWMKACLSSATMSILVNGSPSGEFPLQRGIRQGDPLSPFLFLIAAEGFNCLMKKAIDLNLFEGVAIGREKVMVSHLQFADDTVIIGKASPNNAMTIKGILKLFEISSGLRVNLSKSSLYGIHVNNQDLISLADVIGCRTGNIPFCYLGLPIGANHRKKDTWNGVIERFRKRLSGWEKRTLSFGGRTILLKSVMSALPLYYFSLFKAPVSVIKSMIKLQRDFLWGGKENCNKIAWVSWDSVCRSKDDGGLGIRDLRSFNLALLCKWVWRFAKNQNALWARVLRSRYGGFFTDNKETSEVTLESFWWRDLKNLVYGVEGKIICDNISFSLGNGMSIFFWDDPWFQGGAAFKKKFRNLYVLSAQKHFKVGEMGSFNEREWGWNFHWTRTFNFVEFVEFVDLWSILCRVSLHRSKVDTISWKGSRTGCFSTREMYFLLHKDPMTVNNTPAAFKKIWLKCIPCKVSAFIWKVFQDRIPTRENLMKRRIIFDNNHNCPICSSHMESSDHILLHCSFSVLVWKKVCNWLKISFFSATSILNHFFEFVEMGANKTGKIIFNAIWQCVCWKIWKARNEKIFKDGIPEVTGTIEDIVFCTWSWIKAISPTEFCYTSHEWAGDAKRCFPNKLV